MTPALLLSIIFAFAVGVMILVAALSAWFERSATKPDRELVQARILLERVLWCDSASVPFLHADLRAEIEAFTKRQHKELS